MLLKQRLLLLILKSRIRTKRERSFGPESESWKRNRIRRYWINIFPTKIILQSRPIMPVLLHQVLIILLQDPHSLQQQLVLQPPQCNVHVPAPVDAQHNHLVVLIHVHQPADLCCFFLSYAPAKVPICVRLSLSSSNHPT